MTFDIALITQFYSQYAAAVAGAKSFLSRPLTLTEKILYAHLYDHQMPCSPYERGSEYALFAPDRVAMQDATAQMALLQFMNAGRDHVAVPATVHCDHLIQAHRGALSDLQQATTTNDEVYHFLQDCAARYGIGFWGPGAGIIHQIVLENYAFPGGMMIGTDSHTPNAGGLGMIAIGVGGADAVDVLTGQGWELKFPRIIGVKLTGSLQGWASAKDVILKLAGLLTVKGGTNAIIEYFGPGTQTLSCTGKATICNMGAEVGATTSLFPFDAQMHAYLCATGREDVAQMAQKQAADLMADTDVIQNPEMYYDQVIELDLSTLEPYINGPFTPDAATPVTKMASVVAQKKYPEAVEVVLIGSCTNSSYQDLSRAAALLMQAQLAGIKPKAQLIINPGSTRISDTAERDGLLQTFIDAGAIIMANACGPCIGQWHRETENPLRPNTIITTFNRNFAKRADGNPNTHAFIVSPEMAIAYALSGNLSFNPLTDPLFNENGERIILTPPIGDALPLTGFAHTHTGYIAPHDGVTEIRIASDSERLQRLETFKAPQILEYQNLSLLIKVVGKCTTDHISMAGPWLKYRGHLDRISDNMLLGAVNACTQTTGQALNPLTKEYETVAQVARTYKAQGIGTVIVAEENYGEGSSREHAAMEPRYLNVKVVLAKSFARIHETNLKKQGLLALTFVDKEDYHRIAESDIFAIPLLKSFSPNCLLTIEAKRIDGTTYSILTTHTYNAQQIAWFWAGAALNVKNV